MSPENKQRIIGVVVLVAFIALLVPFLFASGIKKKLSSADEIPINAQKRQLITQQIQSINSAAATPPVIAKQPANATIPVAAEQPANTEQLQELSQDQQVEQADIAALPPENNQAVAATETALTNISDIAAQADATTPVASVKATPKEKVIKKSKAAQKTKNKNARLMNAAASTNAKNLWSVQVGSFSDDAHVQRLLIQLHGNGFYVYTQKITTTTGSLTRVLVGHEASKEQASQIAKKLATTMKIKGRLVKVQK
jgi:DedD protein